MKFSRLTLSLATLGLAVASAASTYNVKLSSATWIGETKLNAGDYKVQIVGDKAVFKSGKTSVEVPATVATNPRRFSMTSTQVTDSKMQEIDLGGTTTKILFGAAAAGSASGSK
jgi:hypothetical protein